MEIRELRDMISKIQIDKDYLDKLIDDYDDFNDELKEELKISNYNKNLYLLLSDKGVSIVRTPEEKNKLIEELKKCGYSRAALHIATNINILRKTTIEKQIRMMQVFEKNEKKSCEDLTIACTASDENLLSLKTFDDIIKLMEEMRDNHRFMIGYLNEPDHLYYNQSINFVSKIMTNKTVLGTKSTNDIIRIAQELKNCEYNDKACSLAVNENMLLFKSADDIIKLMRLLKSFKYREDIRDVIVNEDMLKFKTTDEEISIINAASHLYAGKLEINKELLQFMDTEDLISIIKLVKWDMKNDELFVKKIYRNRTADQLIRLQKAIESCEKAKRHYAEYIVTNEDVLKYRTPEDSIRLVETFKSCRQIEKVYKVAIDQKILSSKTIDEQLQIMQKVDNNEMNINSARKQETEINTFGKKHYDLRVKEIEKILDSLTASNVTEITKDTVVKQKSI